MVHSRLTAHGSRLTAHGSRLTVDKLSKLLLIVCIMLSIPSIAYAQTNLFPLTGNAGINIQSATPVPQRALHINADNAASPPLVDDATIRLSYTANNTGLNISYGHLSLLSPYLDNPTRIAYSALSFPRFVPDPADLVLSASDKAHNLILTTRSFDANVMIGTTPVFGGADELRFVAMPDGRISMGPFARTSCPNFMEPFGVYSHHDISLKGTVAIGNPGLEGSGCQREGVLTFLPKDGSTWLNIRNTGGILKTGTPIDGTSETYLDYTALTGWGGLFGVGFNMNPFDGHWANFKVSQAPIGTRENFFAPRAMRVEVRQGSTIATDVDHILISAGLAMAESFLVYGNGRVRSTTLAGTGTRVVYALPDGSLTATFTGTSGGWMLTGNSGIDENVNFLGTTDNKKLVFKTNNNHCMSIDANGRVLIGDGSQPLTDNDANLKLAVNGRIICREMIVNAATDWADYVFDENYTLTPLADVADYIKENKHLPGIPSAKEVEENGVNVTKMQAKLLEKIEELTLHLIRIDSENKELRQQLQSLNQQKGSTR
ncbi:MAG: hypothetical protein JNL32_05755 [Candidatus Kapabacteria bacterium]|nr:hypothetical protein [Candidatus Kapabacteria bacterium]